MLLCVPGPQERTTAFRAAEAVDGHRRVKPGGAERLPDLRPREVAANARIGDEGVPVVRQIDPECVRMSVRGERQVSVRAVVEERAGAPATQDAQAAIRQRQALGGRCPGTSSRLESLGAFGAKEPEAHRIETPATRAARRWPKRAAIAAATPRPVRSAAASRTSARPSSASPYVGSGSSSPICAHSASADLVSAVHSDSGSVKVARVEQRDDDEEQIEDKHVVGECLLSSGPVRANLALGLVAEFLECTLEHGVGSVELGKQGRHSDDSGELTDAMIVGRAASRRVARDPSDRLPERACGLFPTFSSQVLRAAQTVECDRHRDCANPGLEAVAPCDAAPRRVRFDPGRETLGGELCVSRLVAQEPRRNEQREILTAVELPDPLGIARPGAPVVDSLAVLARPGTSAERIDVGPEVLDGRLGISEELEASFQYGIRPLEQRHALVREAIPDADGPLGDEKP